METLWKWFITLKIDKNLLKGLNWLILVPLVCILGPILLPYLMSIFDLSYPKSPLNTWNGVFLLFFFIYLAFMVSEMPYDYKVLRTITIPAPKQIRDLLKTTTTREGVLINVKLISTFKNNYPLSQTDLVKYVREEGIELTDKRIRDYITRLENKNIIFSPPTAAYKKEYILTEKGKWCYKCIRHRFPKRYFWFIIRNYIGYSKLPPFPDARAEKSG